MVWEGSQSLTLSPLFSLVSSSSVLQLLPFRNIGEPMFFKLHYECTLLCFYKLSLFYPGFHFFLTSGSQPLLSYDVHLPVIFCVYLFYFQPFLINCFYVSCFHQSCFFLCDPTWNFFFFFNCCSSTVVSIFIPPRLPAPPSPPPTLKPTQFGFVHVSFIYLPLCPPLSLSPFPSDCCQFVLSFSASDSILLACL